MAVPVSPTTLPPSPRRRPLGVVLIAAFLIADAVLAIAQRFLDFQSGTRQDLLADAAGQGAAVVILLVVLRVFAAVGLWFGWRRGWVLTMLLVGISLIVDLWLYWEGQRYYLRMAFDVVLAFYLNQGAVREYFRESGSGRRDARPGDVGTTDG